MLSGAICLHEVMFVVSTSAQISPVGAAALDRKAESSSLRSLVFDVKDAGRVLREFGEEEKEENSG